MATNKLAQMTGLSEADGGIAGIGAVVDFARCCVSKTQRSLPLGFFRPDDAEGVWCLLRIALGDVPPILPGEAYADDCTLAAAGPGFDPQRESKTR